MPLMLGFIISSHEMQFTCCNGLYLDLLYHWLLQMGHWFHRLCSTRPYDDSADALIHSPSFHLLSFDTLSPTTTTTMYLTDGNNNITIAMQLSTI